MILKLWLSGIGVLAAGAVRVWPEPAFLDSGPNAQWVSRTRAFEVVLHCEQNGSSRTDVLETNGVRDSVSTSFSGWLQLYLNTDEAEHDLSEAEILRLATHSRYSNFEPSPLASDNATAMLNQVQIHQIACPSTSELDANAFLTGDESYELTVDQGIATVNSWSTLGSLRALQTFEQLFYASANSPDVYTTNTPLHIVDKPKWPHRGLLLDIARNVFSQQDILRTIDAMASTKLNRLHIHATDSQSWPIEVCALPKLASKGAYHMSQVWSADDLWRVQRYGIARGVSVFLEIDMPGHTASVAHAYPDLIAAFNESDWSTFAAEPLSGQFKLNSPAVYGFLQKLFDDLLPRLSRYTTLYHGGGDEVNMNAYLLDDTIRSSDPQIIRPFLQKFMDSIIRNANAHGLQPILWEEMLLDYNLTLPSATSEYLEPDVILQVWRSSKNLIRVIEQGYRVLFGDHEYWYLDCGYGSFLNPYPGGASPPGVPYNTSGGQKSRLKAPYQDYCSPLKNWRHIYSYDPLVNISKDLQHLIEGGEVLLWSEQTDSIDLDSKLWPRAAAAAEVLWAGPRDTRMIDSAERRLAEWRERRVVDDGLRASPVGMTWCLMEGGCQY